MLLGFLCSPRHTFWLLYFQFVATNYFACFLFTHMSYGCSFWIIWSPVFLFGLLLVSLPSSIVFQCDFFLAQQGFSKAFYQSSWPFTTSIIAMMVLYLRLSCRNGPRGTQMEDQTRYQNTRSISHRRL